MRDAFLTELRKFHTACGSPSSTLIIKMNERLSGRGPSGEGEPRATLSKSAISEILRGLRKTLPKPEWLTSFVLSTQRVGHELGYLDADPGYEGVREWQERLLAAEEQARQEDLPVRRGHAPSPVPGTKAPEPGTVRRPRASGSGATWMDPGTLFGAEPRTGPHEIARSEAKTARRFQLSGPPRDYVATYGAFGQSLLDRLSKQDPNAAYLIALLLSAVPAYEDAAIRLLTDVTAATATQRQPLAEDLLQESPRELKRDRAAGHLRALAKLARYAGESDAADAFDECLALLGTSDVDPAESHTAPYGPLSSPPESRRHPNHS